MYKFKPDFSMNFVKRYVQISKQGFRYFKDENQLKRGGKPLVFFRRSNIKGVSLQKINKDSYLKTGSRANKS